jgi:hypothetical protein
MGAPSGQLTTACIVVSRLRIILGLDLLPNTGGCIVESGVEDSLEGAVPGRRVFGFGFDGDGKEC